MNPINVSVVYALPEEQFIYSIKIKKNSTVIQAILKSKIIYKIKNNKNCLNKIGIYGQLVNLNHKLNNNDRIEIYRNLIFSPMEQRRKNILYNNIK
ncbi:UPF0125 protein RatB [Buchnera aphidicola (Eriosoma grossulariae)]|uniref:RnfH family protein n=1 Tax=Buchnera aphidicola TaxID=9 RepID=UPI0034643FA9